MHTLGLHYGIDQVDEPLLMIWNEAFKAEAEAINLLTDIVKHPKPFIKKEKKWQVWKESILTYLNSKTGQGGLPLSYITRENDVPLIQVVYATVHEQLVNCAILHGSEYDTNNGIVYDLLQSLTLNGPAWMWINAFHRPRDGRNAWKSLINFYEEDSTKTRNKQECYDAISKATYQGPKRNFNFNSYVSIHQQVHQDLIRLGEPIPVNKKVRDFLNGITDPPCSNIRLPTLANNKYMKSFLLTMNYISSAIDLVNKNTSSSSHQISNLNSGHSRGRNQTIMEEAMADPGAMEEDPEGHHLKIKAQEGQILTTIQTPQ